MAPQLSGAQPLSLQPTFPLPPSPLIAPLLWLTLTVSLLHDARRPRTSTAPRPAALLLAIFSLSVALVAAFHFVYVTRLSPTAHPLPLLVSPRHPEPISKHRASRLQALPVTVRLAVPVRQEASGSPVPTGPPAEEFPTATDPSPSPVPSPVPPPPPAAAPVPAPAPVGDGQTQGRAEPTLQECGGGLSRMQVILLLEFLLECMFFVVRCLATNDEDEPTFDISFRTFTLVRAIYAVPVLILNASILWIGGGRIGECLPLHPELQIAYTHLILYAIWSLLYVILGLYRLAQYDSEKDSTYYISETPEHGAYPPMYPPSRTSSLYDRRRYSRTRSRFRSTSSTSDTDEPRFYINCGCCKINI